jgi:coenzyme F420 hydrogenase subunit beta
MSCNSSTDSTIQLIVRRGLCTGCGTCAAVCPSKALVIFENRKTGTYQPQLDASKCTRCGSCLKACPSVPTNFDNLKMSVFNRKNTRPFVGEYVRCYSGYATSHEIRSMSTSGGLISALAIFALENGNVDGVLTTRANDKKPLYPHSFIARSKIDVLSSVGSKYCPVPANCALNEVIEGKGRYLVIGLPCHVQGLRKLQAFNKELSNKIPLVFGIVCNHTPSFNATRFLLKKLNIPEQELVRINYRSWGWPGGIHISLKDGSEHFVPFKSSYYWGYVFQKFFWPKSCMVCDDKLCQLADVIFMDAWLPKYSSEKLGISLLAVRSIKGDEFVKKAIEKGIVTLKETSIEDVLKSQSMPECINKTVARKYFLGSMCAENYEGFSPKPMDYLDAFHMVLINKLCRRESNLSDFLIECHAKTWDALVSIKRTIVKLFGPRSKNFKT